MNAIDAMIYCLGYVHMWPSDGEYFSRAVFDCHDNPHWFAWDAKNRDSVTPKLCSDIATPFAAELEPYRMTKDRGE